ncbi:phosphohydrolase domain protein, partial [Acinetobacter baumannii 1397084]
ATSTRLYHHNPNSFNTISNEGKIQHYWFNYDLKIFQLI